MDTAQAFAPIERDGVLSGPVRRPVNLSRDAAGSIHDDATAHKLGFRGGTVAGNIHSEQFAPLLIERFGRGWRKQGGLSLHFLNATTDGEPVQAFVGPAEPGEAGLTRAQVWMETPQGVRVCEGSAWLGGDDPKAALRIRVAQQRPATELRILKAAKVGDSVRDIPARVNGETATFRLQGITEPMAEYTDPKPWGGLVAASAVAIDALRVVEIPMFRPDGDFVGLFGAIELQQLAGPILTDKDYLADGRVLALGESPKTEVVWWESTLRDPDDGISVARLLMMTRFLKASSALWA